MKRYSLSLTLNLLDLKKKHCTPTIEDLVQKSPVEALQFRILTRPSVGKHFGLPQLVGLKLFQLELDCFVTCQQRTQNSSICIAYVKVSQPQITAEGKNWVSNNGRRMRPQKEQSKK